MDLTADPLPMVNVTPRRGRRRLAAVMVAALLVALAACNPDPTGGARPPGPGAPAAGYSSSLRPATRAELPHSWRSGCPVSWTQLSVVTVAYWGYDGKRHVGELVVNDSVAQNVRGVFRSIYDARFQIRRIHPVDDYGADDDRSMAANNTSAFNCRYVAGTTRWSEHAYGWAMDINPVQNPWVKGSTVDPPSGQDWVDRSSVVPGMITSESVVVRSFAGQGWEWGGHWQSSKDYQHLSLTGR